MWDVMDHGEFNLEGAIRDGAPTAIPPAEWKSGEPAAELARTQQLSATELGTDQLATESLLTGRGGSRNKIE